MGDPRVYFASERTLLAWIRTGIAIIGMGFVVARFGLFLQLLTRPEATGSAAAHWAPTALGVALTLLGSLAMLAALVQHQRFAASLPAQDLPARYSRSVVAVFTVLLTLLGLALAAYLGMDGAFATTAGPISPHPGVSQG